MKSNLHDLSKIYLTTRTLTVDNLEKKRVPDTSYHSHFIFGVTSYQREKLSLHTSHFIPSHFIQSDTSYQSLHTSHFIPKSLHTSHFIPVTSYQESLHTRHFIPRVTSYQALHTSHFIPRITSYQTLHTKVTSYRNHLIPRSLHTSHFIPKPLHTKVTS